VFIVSVIVLNNCHILQFLHQLFNLSALLQDDALLNVLLQKSSCFQLFVLKHRHFTR